jgi:hypothetical protein
VTSAGSAMLTVNAASLSMAFTSQSFNTMTGLQATLLPMGIVGFVLLLSYRNRRGRWMLYALLIAATVLPTACGGGSSTRQSKPQNYSVTVSATSGALQHSTTVSVTVQ